MICTVSKKKAMSKESIYKTISSFNVETFKNCNDIYKKIYMKNFKLPA